MFVFFLLMLFTENYSPAKIEMPIIKIKNVVINWTYTNYCTNYYIVDLQIDNQLHRAVAYNLYVP